MERSKVNNELVISYLTLRKVIGILGVLFPFVLALGAAIVFHDGLARSLSHYYYSGMRDVFVGTLCAIGLFLLSYKGYTREDDRAGDLGCVFAVGVALFPTHATPEDHGIVGYIHLIFATLFFLTLIYFSLVLFTKTSPIVAMTVQKNLRNKIYKACGYTMAICIILIAIYKFLPSAAASRLESLKPVLLLEAIAILAFGISWLVKGGSLLADET